MTQPPTGPAAFGSGESWTASSAEAAGEALGASTVEPAGQSWGASTAESAGEPGTAPTAEPAGQTWGASTAEPAGEPWTAPTAEPAGEGGGTPLAEPADDVAEEHAAGPRAAAGVGRRSRRLPGGRVVLVATLAIITVALFEVVERDRIGLWTGASLLAISAIAVLVTRPGDRSLPAMMPPLAFLAAVGLAGQQLLSPAIDDPRRQQAVMVFETLGENAAWVVAATVVAGLLALIGHLLTRRSRRRSAQRRAASIAATTSTTNRA